MTNSIRLFVGSLPWSTTSEELNQLFSRIGKVIDAVVIIDKPSGKSKGYGFVEMSNPEEAQAAINKFNGYEFQGRTLVVNSAAPKAPRSLFQ
jgi:RNA recognition motif-containing protein